MIPGWLRVLLSTTQYGRNLVAGLRELLTLLDAAHDSLVDVAGYVRLWEIIDMTGEQ
jgi:hypothetical protein